MNLTNSRAAYGLNSRGTRTRAGVTGEAVIGVADGKITFSDSDVAYQAQIVMSEATADAAYDIGTGAITTTTAWVAGNAQVETATAAGTITTAGNATITVTAAGMTGSPKAISVAVALNDTASLWAAKVRTALAADADVSAMFAVSGTGADIILTRLATDTWVIGGTTVEIFPADDATLNIASADGTCVGITPAASSANTTAGVATDGTDFHNDDVDFEGIAIPAISVLHGLLIEVSGANITYDAGVAELGYIADGGKRLFINPGSSELLGTLDFTTDGPVMVTVSVVGKV